MDNSFDFSSASSIQIEETIDRKIRRLRLSRNWTREKLAKEAGVSMRTIANLEEGRGTTFNTIIRVMKAFNVQANLSALFPDPTIHPVELLETGGKERKRARTKRNESEEMTGGWQWKE
jgi:transcriptional regulator with XRE-family HTH domain